MRLHYNGGRPLGPRKLAALNRLWQPWRSVATWYLWRSLDPVPVEY
jgi:DNA-3-methyladenine glycosylase II